MNRAKKFAVFGWLVLFHSSIGQAKPLRHPVPIEVQVEVTEVDHLKASRFGLEWLDRIQFLESQKAGVFSLGSIVRPTQLRVDLNFLVQEGAAQLLATPNLITDSGTAAQFHAGGEIPYVTTTSLGSSHVEFKPYGVLLSIKPKLLKNGFIKMNIQAAVSSPDQTNGVVVSGNTVPALLEREVKSNITVRQGHTVTLAGLVQTTEETLTRGIPFLRRIPVLGFLFRWEKKNFRKTTVVIFVTPRLMKYE